MMKSNLIAAIVDILPKAPTEVLEFVYHYIRYMTRNT